MEPIAKGDEGPSMSKLFDQMANHLEFLGYSVEINQPAEGEKPSFIARHSQYPNLFIWEMEPGITLMRSSFNIEKAYFPEEMDAAINELSKSVNIMNPNYVVNNDGKVVLQFDTVYTGDYSREIFGKFIAYVQNDIARMYRVPAVVKAFTE